VRRRASQPRGAILLEVLLALALFVTTSLTLLSIIAQSIDGLTRSRDRLLAADHARSAMAKIEAGIERPEALNGPVQPWNTAEQTALDPSFTGFDPDDAPVSLVPQDAGPGWSLEIETERTEYTGLTLVRVRAFRVDSDGFEYDRSPSFTLSQFVRLGGDDGERGGGEPSAPSVGGDATPGRGPFFAPPSGGGGSP